jgi:prepilin-type N-terminal cleavage/methylation domain-containing protein
VILKKRKNKGFTLIEILLTFGILASLLVAAMVVYVKVSDSSKENKAKDEILLVQETVKDLTRSRSSYKDFNETILVSGNLLPMKMLKKKGVRNS